MHQTGSGKTDYNIAVVTAHLQNFSRIRKQPHKPPRAQKAQQNKSCNMKKSEHQPMGRSLIYFPLILLPHTSGNTCIQTHTGSYRNCKHQVLQRKNNGNSSQRLLAQPAYKQTVYNIIHRLDQHRDHRRYRHRHQQPHNRPGSHRIFNLRHKYSSIFAKGLSPFGIKP